MLAGKMFLGQRPLQLCPIFMQKPEFVVSRLKSRTQPLCQLTGGLEAMPACNCHPACPAFIVPEQEISPGSVICQGGREKEVYLFHCRAGYHSFFLCCPLKCIFCLWYCSRDLTPEHADGTQKGCLTASTLSL